MRLGIETLLDEHLGLIRGKRVGLLAHSASRDFRGVHSVEHLLGRPNCKLTAIFGPEHGLETFADDMVGIASGQDPKSRLPVFSLYSNSFESLSPKKEQLDMIDVLVIDLQDIGARYYTYTWTAVLCMKACAKLGKPVIVCDRPNPIGGEAVEGGEIARGFESFVGLHSIPVRHGMTFGEIVQYVNTTENIDVNLTVCKMEGWGRKTHWPDTGLKWTNPSPNMRSYTAALLYPGMCLIEGTNLSEGRGTDTPFEIVGAPYMDTEKAVENFNDLGLDGIRAAPTSFIPVRRKWAQGICNGVRWIVTDAHKFNSYLTGLAFVWLVKKMYRKKGFEWNLAPYEFVTDRPAIDLLTGSDIFRKGIDKLKLNDLKKMAITPKDMLRKRNEFLIYNG